MKFTKLDLLTLLIGLFLFSSCKDEGTIGLDLDPNNAIQGSLVDSITVNSRTLSEGPAETNKLRRTPFGYMVDPVFGKTEASIAMTVNTPEEKAFSFGNTPELDSAVLVLKFGSQFYGDTAASTYSFEVRQLAQSIHLNESYPSNATYNAAPALIGSYTGKIYPNTKRKVTDIVVGKVDTLKIVPPQIRIKLDKTFIENNIISQQFGNNEAFQNIFNGLKLTLNKANSTGNLGIMFFDFSAADSKIEFYYKTHPSASVVDTVLTNFPISYLRNAVAATVTHDYTGTPVATQLANPSVQYPVSYIQGAAGLRTKISFPFLKKFSQNAGKIVVNKAELVVKISSGSAIEPFGAAKRLVLYKEDIAGKRQSIIDRIFFRDQFGTEALGDAAFGGYFDSANMQYVFVVTNYVQDLIDGKYAETGTFLAATPTSEFDYLAPTLASAARTVIGSGAKDASGNYINPTNRIKLNIYYTPVK